MAGMPFGQAGCSRDLSPSKLLAATNAFCKRCTSVSMKDSVQPCLESAVHAQLKAYATATIV